MKFILRKSEIKISQLLLKNHVVAFSQKKNERKPMKLMLVSLK